MPPQEPITSNTPPADDLPLTITRAVEAVERGETPPGAPATEPSRPAVTPDTAAEGATPTGDKPRDSQGRFAPKPAPAGTDPASVPAEGATPAPTDTAPKPAATDTPSVPAANADTAPQSWKDGPKAKWASIDPEVRAEIRRREREIDVAMDASARRAQAAASILDEFAPYEEILHQEGATPQAAIRTLLQTAYALRSAGPEYRKAIFLDLAQQYGVDLSQGINPELAQAQAALAQTDISQRDAQARMEAEQRGRAAAIIEQFAQTHEHFPKVREIMGNLMATGVCRDLETAYAQACALHPELRPALIAAEAERIAKERMAEENRRRNAASSVGGSPGGFAPGPAGAPAAPSGGGDLRSAIAAAMDRVA